MKKFSLLLVALLALSLLFCFGVVAWADDPVEGGDTAKATDDVNLDDEDDVDEDDVDVDEDEDEVEVTAAFVIPAPEKVVISNQALKIDGELVEAAAYNIDGKNYFKLRDLAALLAETGSEFDVTYEAPNMIVTTGKTYTKLDGDLAKVGEPKKCVPSPQVLLVNGKKVDILVYNIDDNNYFQLAGLGELLNFDVKYDDATRTMLVTTADVDDADADDTDADGEDDDEGEGEDDETEGEDEEPAK